MADGTFVNGEKVKQSNSVVHYGIAQCCITAEFSLVFITTGQCCTTVGCSAVLHYSMVQCSVALQYGALQCCITLAFSSVALQ